MLKEVGKQTASETNFNNLNSEQNTDEPILPRSAWNSQLTQLRILIKAKQTLDQQERSYISNISSNINM